VELVKERNLVPFLDMAYQGFADGIEPDGAAVRLFAESGLQFFVSSSFSKSFSLYGERVGALSIVTTGKEEAQRVLSQLKRVIRTNYSNPPTHGGAVVATVLNSPELRAMWEQELAEMRDRIKLMRHALVDKLAAKGVPGDFVRQGPARHVLVLGPDLGPGGPPAQRVRHLRREHRPHLRGRAEQPQHRRRGERDRRRLLNRRHRTGAAPKCGIRQRKATWRPLRSPFLWASEMSSGI
jgi:histidinol-phosphate/aromatic aminotransferase/cobyric acid decarboxylase-like protein